MGDDPLPHQIAKLPISHRFAAQSDHPLDRACRLEPERERAADQADAENDHRIEAGPGHALKL